MNRTSPATRPEYRNIDPERWSIFDQAAGLFLLGLIYSLVLGGLAFGLVGGGHGYGSEFSMAVGLPGLVFWPAAVLAVAFADRPIGRWIGPSLLLVQYLLCIDTIASTSAPGRHALQMVWARDPGVVLFFCKFFLTGQAAIWIGYAIKRRQARQAAARRRITLAEVMMAIVITALLMAMIVIPARWIFGRG